AAAHHISTRYLHRLFQDQGLTVSSWIRRLRLERCRRALANPTLAAVPVGAIAARWGFAQPAVFTRAFRAAYGLTPSEVRARTLMSNGSALAVNNSAPMVKDVG
ncbi:helix-turn-helix domain-containing protein, partial [Streptomyces atriruber]